MGGDPTTSKPVPTQGVAGVISLVIVPTLAPAAEDAMEEESESTVGSSNN